MQYRGVHRLLKRNVDANIEYLKTTLLTIYQNWPFFKTLSTSHDFYIPFRITINNALIYLFINGKNGYG